MIIINGRVVAQGSQFSLTDVEVVTATVDLEDVRSFRCSPSRGLQATHAPSHQRLELDARLSKRAEDLDPTIGPSDEIEFHYHLPEEEIALGSACWLWDHLRRCGGAAGFFLPLSGCIDSCATATVVFSMCRLVVDAVQKGNEQVIKDARRVCGEPESSKWLPTKPEEVCNRTFHTCFMGTTNSSKDTRSRAKTLATDIGAYHVDLDMDSVVTSLINLFSLITDFRPRFTVHSGSKTENLALQNIQARLRMVIAYLFAQLLPTIRQHRNGWRLASRSRQRKRGRMPPWLYDQVR